MRLPISQRMGNDLHNCSGLVRWIGISKKNYTRGDHSWNMIVVKTEGAATMHESTGGSGLREGATMRDVDRNCDVSDRQLLERFIAKRDENAFTGLVERHSRTVWCVCKRMLHNEHDAEDAFQAVFLTLARNADSIRQREAVGCWLYGVAYRTALKARLASMRRKDCESKAETASPEEPPWSAAACRDLQRILDGEVQRLAEKYRAPFILCCLEGKSKAEAAQELGWKEGTVSGRLAQARKLLQSRLARRGISLTAVLTAIALVQQSAAAAASDLLVHGTIQAVLTPVNAQCAAGALSPAVLALAENATPALAAVKTKLGVFIASLAALITGMSVVAYQFIEPNDLPQPEPPEQVVKVQARPIQLQQSIDERVFAVAFSPDGTKLITAGALRELPGQIKFWNVPAGDERSKIRGVTGVRTVAYASDGKTFVTGDFAGDIKIRDADTGAEKSSIKGHANGVNSLAFSSDGETLVSAGLDRITKLWDAKTLKVRKSFGGHTGMVYSAAFFRHGNAIVTGSEDSTAKIWDIRSGKQKFTLRGHKLGVEMVAVSPDDKTVVTASWDRTIKFWDAETGTETGELKADSAVFAVAFASDGKSLASTGGNGTVRLWDVKKRELIKVLGQHGAATFSLAFSYDDRYLASGSLDRTAKIWDVKSMKEMVTLDTKELQVDGKDDKPPPKTKGKDAAIGPPPPRPDVVELLEDGTDFFIDNLDNNGGRDGSVAVRDEKNFYSGTCSLSVSPFQRFKTQLPGWNFPIKENPRPGEFRYLRFAWKRTEASGILLQLYTRPNGAWEGYYAGTLSKIIKRPMIRVADEPPRKWELVTRDLYKDFGAITITGINFSAMPGGGEASFDHIYLARTIEDLDRAGGKLAKAAEPVDAPDAQTPPARSWGLPVAIAGAGVVLLVACVLLVVVIRRGATARPTAVQQADEAAPPEPVASIGFSCESCGKKLKAKAASAGKSVKCPQCGKSSVIPASDRAP